MQKRGFLTVIVPSLSIFFLLCLGAVYISVAVFDDLYKYLLAAVLSQFSITTFRVFWIARKYTKYSRKHKTKKLAEGPAVSIEDRFVIHLAEEALKLTVLVLCTAGLAQQGVLSVPSYIVVVGGIFALNKLVCNLATFSPVGYEQRYAKFIKLYEKYESYVCSATETASIGSSGSALLIGVNIPSVLQISDEKSLPQFNLNLFENLEQPKIVGIPIPGATETTLAHLDMIDRLYSVSPKDTAYLSYEYSGEEAETNDAKRFRYETLEFQHRVEERTDFSNNEEDKDSTISEQSCSEHPSGHFLLCLSWWAWLLPIPSKRSCLHEMSSNSEKALIKKKLSTYTLNSNRTSNYEKRSISRDEDEMALLNSSKSFQLYGSIDLERQSVCLSTVVLNSHRYHDFARFVNGFLDFWSPSLTGLMQCIDPAFMKFGVSITDVSAFYFSLYGASVCMWQISSASLLGISMIDHSLLPVLVTALLLVAKLFCVNFLHGQCVLSYKFSIASEFALNSVLFLGASCWLKWSAHAN